MSSLSIGRKAFATTAIAGIGILATAAMASAADEIVATQGNCEVVVTAPSITDSALFFVNDDTIPALLPPGESVTIIGEAGDSFLITIKTNPVDETEPVEIASATVTIDACVVEEPPVVTPPPSAPPATPPAAAVAPKAKVQADLPATTSNNNDAGIIAGIATALVVGAGFGLARRTRAAR